ncbi:MAG: alpha-2-macroglobulin family protein, partial [Myxococcaceae bacterium]|nr:alpha-2-macroglobulin family protein [Myxococcaceae bacterium]
MKKVLVLLLTGFSILALFVVFASSSRRYAASADALAGDEGRFGLRRQEAGMRKTLKSFGESQEYAAPSPSAVAPGAPPPAPAEAMAKGGGGYDLADRALGGLSDKKLMNRAAATEKEEAAKEDDSQGGSAAPTRAWFPETFLFEPLVVTDSNGRATVPVKVPDRLTTWRVLALAHSRQGGQAGAVTSFLGTLPTYVEPVVPPMLYAGDSVVLPVQVVNTTEREVTSPLRLESTGVLSSAGGSVRVAAGGSVVQNVTLQAKQAGPLVLKATLGSTDAIQRVIDVKPAGQRETVTKGGTLAAARTFTLDGPANALPNSEKVALRVFPGALGLVRSELSAAPGRGGVAEDAYLLQLLGSAPTLLRNLGEEPAMPVIRDLSVVATQRVMRHARGPSVDTATLLAEAALTHPDNPVLARLGERLAAQVARAQRGDGTFEGATGWTLQRLLVTTGDALRALNAAQATPLGQQRATAAKVRAAGAYERNLGRIADPYTAASALASGAVSGTGADTRQELVRAGIVSGPDGATLSVPTGVVRADGQRPGVVEATALAVLALSGDAKAPLADLGTTLLSAYNPYTGWGDGRTNLLALRAVATLFKDKVPPGVKVTLARDGQVLATGELTPQTLKEVLVLEADAKGSSGAHEWKVTAEPPLAGLGYTLGLVAYVPWKASEGGGLELQTTVPEGLKVGLAADVALTAAYPAGTGVALRYGLPAGVQHDTPSLDALVSAGTITRYETEDGAVTLHLPPQRAGETWQGR